VITQIRKLGYNSNQKVKWWHKSKSKVMTQIRKLSDDTNQKVKWWHKSES